VREGGSRSEREGEERRKEKEGMTGREGR